MAGNPIRLGLIGTGRIARAHVEALSGMKDRVNLVAVTDTVPERAAKFVADQGLPSSVSANLESLLNRTDIDVVDICTPPFVRQDPVVAALSAGKHVICEKPFAASLEEYDSMIEASRRFKKNIAIMVQSRYSREVLGVRKIVESGALGPILYCRAHDNHWRDDVYYQKEWRGSWEYERGGALMNLGIHILDVFLWIMGAPSCVSAESGALGHAIKTDDISSAVLRFKDGGIGTFSCTTTFAEEGATMEFGGKRAFVRYPLAVGAYRGDEDGFPDRDEETIARLTQLAKEAPEWGGDFADVYKAFFDSLRGGPPCFTDAETYRPTIETITAIYKSAATGERVCLPIRKDDPWYTTVGIREGMATWLKKNGGNIQHVE